MFDNTSYIMMSSTNLVVVTQLVACYQVRVVLASFIAT